MSNSRIVRPIELKQKDQHMIGMAVSLFLLALSIALYPIYKRPAILYYSIFGTILAILCFGFSYWVDSTKNKTVFKMDGNGVYYCDEDHDKKPHYFDWSDLKQVSVKRAPKESEKKGKLLYFITQDDTEYGFDLFPYVLSIVWTTRRLKKAVPYFSKGSVPFKHYTI
jgi:hypothetical protein